MEAFDPYYEWLGIPPKDQPPHAYRLLGLELFESNPRVIDSAAEQRMLLLKSRQGGPQQADSQRLLNEVAQAQRLLLDADRKKIYDDQLRAAQAKSLPVAIPLSVTTLEPPSPSPAQPAWPQAQIATMRPRVRQQKTTIGLLIGLGGLAGVIFLIAAALMTWSNKSVTVAEKKAPVAKPPGKKMEKPPATSVAPEPASEEPVTRSPMAPNLEPERQSEPTSGKPSVEPSPNASPAEELPVNARPPRLQLPSEEERTSALADLRKRLQGEYAKAKTASDKASLARQLAVDAGGEQATPIDLATALLEGQRLAAESGELVLALTLIDRIEEKFEVERLPLDVETFAECAKAPLPAEKKRPVLQRLYQFAERLIEADQLTIAAELLKRTEQPVEAARDKQLAEDFAALRRRGAELYREFKPASESLDRLQESADDPTVNAAAGRYYCLARAQWARGLPLLTKGDDEPLRKLAAEELLPPDQAASQLALADAWWSYAESLFGLPKSNAQLRAGQWYREALRGLQGDDLARADQRVAALQLEGLFALDRPQEERPLELQETAYLDDLDEEMSFSLHGTLGRHGETGFRASIGLPRFLWQGNSPKQALLMHAPPPDGRAYATYYLASAYRRFVGEVGAVETETGREPASPLIFRVYADNRLLWESSPIKTTNVGHPFDLDVSYVESLRLEVACLGNDAYADAVWLNPRLIGGRYPLSPLSQRRKRRTHLTYLGDLLDSESVVGHGNLGRFGRVGNGATNKLHWVTNQGLRAAHSLTTVAPSNGSAVAAFNVNRRFSVFKAKVGIASYPDGPQSTSPQIFQVFGDGRMLWKSREFHLADKFEDCTVQVERVKQLRLEVKSEGAHDNAFSAWLSPEMEPIAAKEEELNSHSVRADRIVLWNTRNGPQNNFGTTRVNVLLYLGTQLVWQECGVRLPWDGTSDHSVSLGVPSVRFNRLRVEVTDGTGNNGAGLNEIEVFQGSENLAPTAVATASDSWMNGAIHESFAAKNVIDGLKSNVDFAKGYWLLPDASLGWIELEWQPTSGRTNQNLAYELRRHPETGVPFQNHWYVYFKGSITQENAKQQCARMGGYLACIESAEENEFVHRLCHRQRAAIGGVRTGSGWHWATGEKLKFVRWMKGQPDNAGSREIYLEMSSTGEWNDISNDDSGNRGYVCEWEF